MYESESKSLIDSCIKKEELLKELKRWDDEVYFEYNSLFKKFKVSSTTEKGESLEALVKFILSKTKFFNVYGNIRTSTNEIDQLVIFKQEYKSYFEKDLKSHGFKIYQEDLGLDPDQGYFICECKNYNKAIDVTWVGKFYSLMKALNCKIGIIFSYYGLSGKKALKDACGLTRILNIKEGMYIIDFNIDDFTEINNKNNNFIDLVIAKKNALKFDTNYKSFFQSHPNEEIALRDWKKELC
ncbi:MAG: hypothetical protein FWC47_13270 [Oscillospiraceae bacterium]|nr:hypothetical protein [Oscillospiraceae bacterium]